MQTWFITGASGGLASQVTKQLLARGDRVAATVRKADAMQDLQAEYADQLKRYQLDLTDAEQINAVVNQAFHDFGTIDVILNNAAYGLYGAIEEVSDQQIQQIFQVNVFGSLRVARAAMPLLRQQQAGQIIQIGSMAGTYSEPAMGLYSASKWAIEGAFEALSMEAAPFGIKVTIIEPGGIRTNFAGGKAQFGQPIAAYDNSAVRKFGGVPENVDIEQLKKAILGDPTKMARQIIRRADLGDGPLRLALGSDAYNRIHESLENRLRDLDAQRDISYSTDADD